MTEAQADALMALSMRIGSLRRSMKALREQLEIVSCESSRLDYNLTFKTPNGAIGYVLSISEQEHSEIKAIAIHSLNRQLREAETELSKLNCEEISK